MNPDDLKSIVTNAINGHITKIISLKNKENPEEDLYLVKILHLIKSNICNKLPNTATLQTTITKINHHIFEVHFVYDKNSVIKCLVDEMNHISVEVA